MDTECENWRGCVDSKGYGVLYFENKRIKPHRIAYVLRVGVIPKGKVIDHLCKNRKCINPLHLEAVTNKVNLLRGNGWGAKNARKTTCMRGHPFAGNNLILRIKGGRYCRECRKLSDKRRREKVIN